MRSCGSAAGVRRLVLTALLALGISGAGLQPAAAARVGSVSVPSTLTVNAAKLILNGFGLRTYSILAIHIYVAGLYLERPSHNAQAILASPDIKVLQIHFVHDVSAAGLRGAWRTGLRNNCMAPCMLSPALLSRFLAALQPVRTGDVVTFAFARNGVTVSSNGKVIGTIMDRHFAQLMLAVFLGPHVAAPRLKSELLGLG
jgi:hypothetical protein